MSKGSNQKLKLYYLSRIMMELTDDEHSITLRQVKDELEKYGVTADRKSLYEDLEMLSHYGLDIIKHKAGRNADYHVGAKHFDLAEIRFLIDAVQSSKSLTERQSADLIRKLEHYVSRYEAADINRQIRMGNRGKTDNKLVLYHVDEIHRAICNNKILRVFYQKHKATGESKAIPEYIVDVSPWMLTCHEDRYLLIGYEGQTECLCKYHLECMRDCNPLDGRREGSEVFKDWLQQGMNASILEEGGSNPPNYENTIKNTRSD